MLKSSLLFHSDQTWTKKDGLFDVTMSSYDSTETCELIDAYMLSLLPAILKNNVGLHRDDGLAVCRATPRMVDNIKKKDLRHL